MPYINSYTCVSILLPTNDASDVIEFVSCSVWPQRYVWHTICSLYASDRLQIISQPGACNLSTNNMYCTTHSRESWYSYDFLTDCLLLYIHNVCQLLQCILMYIHVCLNRTCTIWTCAYMFIMNTVFTCVHTLLYYASYCMVQ